MTVNRQRDSLSNLASCLASADGLQAAIPNLHDSFLSKLTTLLLNSSLLSTLRDLQTNLDPLDIEGLLKLVTATNSDTGTNTFTSIASFEPTMSDWAEFVSRYQGADRSVMQVLPSSDQSAMKFYVLAYLLSASFKDCSLMLRFPSGLISPEYHIIDLDTKSASRLDRWHALDREIASVFHDDKIQPCTDAK